jgi:hypothetical protein
LRGVDHAPRDLLGRLVRKRPDFLKTTFDGNMMIWMGIAAGAVLVFGGLGFALGGKGE